MGLVVNLGHGMEVCPSPQGNVREMQVIDTNGIFHYEGSILWVPAGMGTKHGAVHPTTSCPLVSLYNFDSELCCHV